MGNPHNFTIKIEPDPDQPGEERLIAGVNFLNELTPKLRNSLVLFKHNV